MTEQVRGRTSACRERVEIRDSENSSDHRGLQRASQVCAHRRPELRLPGLPVPLSETGLP